MINIFVLRDRKPVTKQMYLSFCDEGLSISPSPNGVAKILRINSISSVSFQNKDLKQLAGFEQFMISKNNLIICFKMSSKGLRKFPIAIECYTEKGFELLQEALQFLDKKSVA